MTILTDEERFTAITEIRLKDHSFGVSELAREMGCSRTTLHRKIKGILHCSASRFICHKRLDKACQLLQNENISITEIAFECGFHSITYFDKCFRLEYHLSPGEFRNSKKGLNIPILVIPFIGKSNAAT